MLRAIRRSWLAAIFLLGCPADDESSSSDPAAGTTTAAPATSTDASDGAATSADSTTGTAGCQPGREPAGFTEVDGCTEAIGEPFCSEGQEHVPQDSEVAWLSDPPHSGPHYPTWERWGEHDSTVPRGNWVHAPELEELLCFADQHENHAPEDVP